jgi:flagellar basal-body rod protein FlgB
MRMMSASSERARVIASNIANENTPGYRRQVVRFEELLRDAARDHRTDLLDVQPSVETDALTPPRADGNNVTLELELNASRQNRLLYETYATILQTHFELMRAGIESGH